MPPEEAEQEEAQAQEGEPEAEGAPEGAAPEKSEEEEKAEGTTQEAAAGAEAAEFPSFEELPSKPSAESLNMLMDVGLKLRVELGRTKMLVEDILRLGQGSVIELNKLAGDPVDVLVNDRLVAKGEVLVVDENFCIRITEIISPSERVAGAEE